MEPSGQIKKQENEENPFFPFLQKNYVTRVVLLGGIGNIVKVPHIDREVSFGNRHSKISGPKDFLQKNCKSSHPTVQGRNQPNFEHFQSQQLCPFLQFTATLCPP